ncbi:MAG TPA: hypothetical protein VMB72_01905 [Acidimicrobiales bacterium]|nr:hypothetical protein [Acidimicrobiales bacterium]
MSRRIDIELTSHRDDGTWTWRAPGARQPRGTVEGGLLPQGSNVGDVLRAEADFDIDGIVVTAVLAPKGDARADKVARIEIVGSGRDQGTGVSVMLAPGGRRRDGDDVGGRPRREGRPRGRDGRGRDAPPGPAGAGPRRRPEGDERGRRERPGRDDERGGRSEQGPGAERTERTGRGPARPGRPGERPGRDRTDRGRRLQTVSTNRNAALASLRPEQLPVAEQLLRGGIPAVRQAIEEQNTRARSEGRGEVSPEPLLSMAEELLPRMNLAAWKDRAVAARNAGKDAPLREVRSVVTAASTVTLDEEGRELLTAVRDALQTRVTALREAWLGRIVGALDDGRVADALRVSSRAPEPAARVPAELAVRLSESAGQALGPDLAPSAWRELLEAVVDSPVRRTVKPAGLPADPGEELLAVARRAAGAVPEVARLLGLPIPPPPGPRRPSPSAARGA